MIDTIRSLLGIKKRILLTVPAFFPAWHSRYGEQTHLATRLLPERGAKIHALKLRIEYWSKAADKFRTGRYDLVICYKGDDSERVKFYPLMRSDHLHIQAACFPDGDEDHVLVEGKKIPVGIVARNEGYSRRDFMEWRKYIGSREFCIVHFTGFRY